MLQVSIVVDDFSLVCASILPFNLHLKEWSMDNNMVSKIWVEMWTDNIHLCQFKIQSHLQKREIWIQLHQYSFWRKRYKIVMLQSPFCFFSLSRKIKNKRLQQNNNADSKSLHQVHISKYPSNWIDFLFETYKYTPNSILQS